MTVWLRAAATLQLLWGSKEGAGVTGSRATSVRRASVRGAAQTVQSTEAPPTAQPRWVQPKGGRHNIRHTVIMSLCSTWLVHICPQLDWRCLIPHLKHCYRINNANVHLPARAPCDEWRVSLRNANDANDANQLKVLFFSKQWTNCFLRATWGRSTWQQLLPLPWDSNTLSPRMFLPSCFSAAM